MEEWKKLAIRAAGFGAASVIIAALLIGSFAWWSRRPVKPKPWNNKAITASFEAMDTEGDNNTITFIYTLQNNTALDYRVSDGGMIHLGAVLKRSKEFSFERGSFLSVDYPFYLPAKSRIRFVLHIRYPYSIKDDLTASDDARHDWETNLCRFANKQFSNLNGFVLLDENTRYQVDMPNGWTSRANEPLRIKAPVGTR